MSKRRAAVLLGCVVCGLGLSRSLGAQTIRGVVVDAEFGTPVLNAEVVALGARGFKLRTMSDSAGAFTIPVRGKGAYTLLVTALGFEPADSTTVELEQSWQQVDVLVRLAMAPLEIEGITVVARGLDVRHRATLAGFKERHANAHKAGPARVLSINDPLMNTSFDVGDVLKWIPTARQRRCTVVFIDGNARPGWAAEVEFLEIDGLQGIEFYLHPQDAPLEFRGGGPPCLGSSRFSILALWRRDPPLRENLIRPAAVYFLTFPGRP